MSRPGEMGYAPRSDDGAERGERGYRRKKLAAMAGAMAGNIYRTGQLAVTELRETYAQSKARGLDGDFESPASMHIPGAFPDVAVTAQGSGEQLIIFPSYAKQHNKRERGQPSAYASEAGNLQDEDYWRSEWERHQDERAIVDVDVRGWLYYPHTGPITRRNRILIGLARQLSGIPVPRAEQAQAQATAPLNPNEEQREQEKIAQEAAMIERRGREEKRIANSGAYSEQPREDTGLGGSAYPLPRPPPPRVDSRTSDSLSGSPKPPPSRQNSSLANELTEGELVSANANLMARIAPFMTNPLVAHPITIFFYNDTKSQSRNVLTDDSGHFAVRAPLDFVPTHVRVLVKEGLSTTQEVKYIEPYGVSLISDIDDTVKTSNISAGAREIFRNTFVRELGDLTIEGVKEWYGKMHALGVSVHYCSNSPWQLYPMLATFFRISGLPVVSLHLKQYSGMLQGIFEPVAERKKNTLVRLLRDFPQRKFLLVGDSGEADLEVYTELALAYPGRVLAVFIRDVTTPEAAAAYFEPSFDMTRRTLSGLNLNNSGPANSRPAVRQNSAPGQASNAKPPAGPVMGTLIDFSDEPEEAKLDEAAALEQVRKSRPGPSLSATELLARKPPPPPRPAKPAALASSPALPTARKPSVGLGISGAGANSGSEPPPVPARKPVGSNTNQPVHPLAQIQNSSQQTIEPPKPPAKDDPKADKPPPPPPPPRRSTKNLSPRMLSRARGLSANSDVDFDPLPPSLAPAPAAPSLSSFYRPNSRSGNTSPSASPTLGAVNKKLEMWRRRLQRAHEQLDQAGVRLYTWRKGQDVEEEAVGIVKRYLAEMDKERGR